jgi:hypothetical protein
MVDARRESFELQQYRKNRSAQLQRRKMTARRGQIVAPSITNVTEVL